MKKALPAIVPILFLIFLIPTTTVFANDGDGRKTPAPESRTSGFPHHNIPPYHGFVRERSWWDDVKDLFGRNNEHDGGVSSATPGGSASGPSSTGPSSGGPAAPLDGGISLLLAAGIGLGIKKAKDRYKNIHKQTPNAG
jgi:hypothetical protein